MNHRGIWLFVLVVAMAAAGLFLLRKKPPTAQSMARQLRALTPPAESQAWMPPPQPRVPEIKIAPLTVEIGGAGAAAQREALAAAARKQIEAAVREATATKP